MQVLIPRFYGMCFGVRDALAMAEAVEEPERVTILGELVHNEEVGRRLAARGFRSVGESSGEIPRDGAVLVTAHGTSDHERARYDAAGLSVIDTTCPLVRNAHEAARRFDAEDRLVVVVGRADHVEVRGLTGDLRAHVVIASAAEARDLGAPRIGVLSQTTTPPDVFADAARAVRDANPRADVAIADTVCRPTRDRQEALAELLDAVDLLVVVGGARSRNAQELVAAAERAGVRAFRISSAEELQPERLAGAVTVGLTAGTSTLPGTFDAVHRALLALER